MIGFYGLLDKSTKVSVSQILHMERAIGYNLASVKRRIHRMCYNFFDAGEETNDEWEELCKMGLATRHTAFGRKIYRVTQRGIDLVSQITGAKIYQDPNMWTGEERK